MKKKKLRLKVEAFGAAGRIRTAQFTPRNHGFAGAPDLGFDVLGADEVGWLYLRNRKSSDTKSKLLELLGGFEPPTSSLPKSPLAFYGVLIHVRKYLRIPCAARGSGFLFPDWCYCVISRFGPF